MWKLMTVVGMGLLVVHAGAEEAVLKSKTEMVSYGIGVNIAKSFKRDKVDFDMKLLEQGIKDGLGGGKLLMPERELRGVMNDFQSDLRRKEMAARQVAAAENKKKEEAFLAENKARKDVVTLASGLQYKVLKAGDGRKPTDADTIKCDYRGTLLDGTEFTSTAPGKPATLKVEMLPDGWKEAMKLMPAGSKWQIYIPSRLAYGERGAGSDIGPNEMLVLDVALLDVK